jgi:three-Cys-motif partner protein
MKSLGYYRGREQTYLKHFFLERYLERVAYNIGSFANEFVYVDGFSGPWQSAHEALEDTSFIIAIRKLREVREGLAKVKKHPRIRCLFIEKDAAAFARLERAISVVKDMDVRALHTEFEQAIPDILRFIGSAFSLVFIDPTGWTGFGLKKIAPILQHQPGEVLVNFMMNYINWLLEDPRPEIAATFEELFGGPGWQPIVQGAGAQREEAILDFYKERMRVAGGFAHVTSTRILMPATDRTYFHLVYGTRHVKGLVEFRKSEEKCIQEQEQVRLTAKQDRRVERTGQHELFAATAVAPSGPPSFNEERANQQRAAVERLRTLLRTKREVPYPQALAALLEMPLVWESDVKRIVIELRDAGEIDVRGLKPRERTPKKEHVLVWKGG